MANNPNRNQYGAKNSRIETPSMLVPNTLMVFNNNIHISSNMPLFFAHPNNYNNRADDSQILTVPMPRKRIANFWENPQIFNIPQTYYHHHPEYCSTTANMTPFNETRKFNSIDEEDKDDVVFVASYTRTARMVNEPIVRRNPTRKARENNKYFLKKEHILEADFGILDENDEANLVTWKSRPSSTAISATSSTLEENFAPKDDILKEWPINSFERPEYNSKTEKVEPFDYTIRNIQNQQLLSDEPEFKIPKFEIVKPIITIKPKGTRTKKCSKIQINNNLRRSKRGEEKKICSSELSKVIEKTDCLLSNIETVSLPFKKNLNNIKFNQSIFKIIILSGANYENCTHKK